MENSVDANRAQQDPQSTSIAVPYWPCLKQAVGSVNAALVVNYLEMRYPSPPPEPGRRYGLPATVDFARMADDLAVDRRTLGLAFMCVSTWYESELRRIGAIRAGREFLNLKHSRFPKLKLYSIVASREWRALETLTLRRNWPLLEKTLAECGVAHHIEPHRLPRRDYAEFSSAPTSLLTLPEILLKGVELAQDRRKTRYSRLRTAVENGLLPADALKVRRPPNVEETDAVDPVLGDELMARLARRRR